ncbi:MAG: NUDIX domain-containing protein, partial [Candidatus Gracilibacteria bacterium]
KLRAEVHRDGDWHRSIDIWIINPQNELLIQKRAMQKESYPGLWEVSCSGHVAAGEESLKSAIRELKEELSVEVAPTQLQFLFEDKEINITNNGTFINKEFKEIYLLKLDWPVEKYTVQKEEVESVKYISQEGLKEALKINPQDFVPHDLLYEKFFQILSKTI